MTSQTLPMNAPEAVCPAMVTDDIPVGPIMPIAVSIRTAAAMVGLSERTLAQVIADDELPTAKIGGRRLVPVDALRQWFNARIEGGAS